MNPHRLLFGLLLGMTALFAVICLIAESPGSTGVDHAAFPKGTLQQAPADRNQVALLVAGTLYGMTTYVLAVACLLLGIGSARRPNVAPLFTCGSLVCGTTVLLVGYLHWESLSNALPYFGGFPAGTAALLYLVPAAPLVFVLFYAAYFSRWIMTPEDERSFAQLVASRRARER